MAKPDHMYKFVLLFLLFSNTAIAQRKLVFLKSPTKHDDECAKQRDQCSNNHTYTVKQLRAFYPFNVAKTVRLISFEYVGPTSEIIFDNKPPPTHVEPGHVFTAMKPGEFVVDYSLVKEFRDLKQPAIDRLTDTFYNIGYTPKICYFYNANSSANCYEPRNAILFIDAKGRVVEYMEICFGCQRYYLSSSKMQGPILCEQKFEMLRQFFAAQGITYGTNKEH